MILPANDAYLFFELYKRLLIFTCNKWKMYNNIYTIEDFDRMGFEGQLEIRNQLYDDIKSIDEFCEKNPENLTEKGLEIVLNWKNYIHDRFLFYKQYKKYCAVFYGKQSIVFGVKGLSQSFDQILPYFPIYVQAVLLPFKDYIVSDGFFVPYSISFGGNMKKMFKRDFDMAKSQYGIVERLPYEPLPEIEIKSNRLKYYLKNVEKYPEYKYDIKEILSNEPSLEIVYHQELGKKNSKIFTKKLLDYNFDHIWFACLDEIVIASGTNEHELKDNIDRVVPENVKEFVYIFKI